MARRLPPWHYSRDRMPSTWTLRQWRLRALELAKEKGAPRACQLCKRPMRQWGLIRLKHPRSYGNERKRIVCIACANLLIHMLDVLEWHGAEEHMPPEEWEGVTMPGDLTEEDRGKDPLNPREEDIRLG